MDVFARLLLRMALWVRTPPSRRWLIAASIAVAVAAMIVTLEHYQLWPNWMQADRLPRSIPIKHLGH